MKKSTLIILLIASIPIVFLLYVGGVILYGTLTDFQPDAVVELEVTGQAAETVPKSHYDFLIWNIGYSGLGAESDFFMDGGSMSVPPQAKSEAYFKGIHETLENYRNTDFVLLQEVDRDATRSYHLDQFDAIRNIFTQHQAVHAQNYNVKFVPVPFSQPLGSVISGLASYSKMPVESAKRHQFPGKFPWPKRIFFLDRCFMVIRTPLAEGKELLVINTHNSAYDSQGQLKSKEMGHLKEFLLEEYEKGNFIVVGGDWNQCPPNFDLRTFQTEKDFEPGENNIPLDYLPSDWLWVYSPTVPTNRKLAAAFEKGKTFTTVIDYYLVSPNIEVEEVRGVNLDFANSDHQPVYMKVNLKRSEPILHEANQDTGQAI